MSISVCATAAPKQSMQFQFESLSHQVTWSIKPLAHRDLRKTVAEDIRRMRYEDEYNGIITSRRDAARNAREGLESVWWDCCLEDYILVLWFEKKGYNTFRDVQWMVETLPGQPMTLRALRAKPTGFETLLQKLRAEEARNVPTLATYANPPVLKGSIPELAERISCTADEYAILLRTQDKYNDDGEALFPDAPSDKFLRLFPDYKPQSQQ